MEPDEVILRRIHAQGLAGAGPSGPAQVVSLLGAVQAQEYEEARWALAQRCGHPAATEVEDVLESGEVVRTHVLRPTWHFVNREDVRWMERLTGPRIAAGDRSRLRQLGLDHATIRAASEAAERILAGSEPRTRMELRAALAEAGIELDASQMGHLCLHLELRELVCSGPRRGRMHTYVRLGPRVGRGRELTGDEALAELARRYFASHGPATVADFAWWSGLTRRSARRALDLCGEDFEEIGGPDGGAYFAKPGGADARLAGALMLSSFDELTVGYRDLRTVSPAGEPSRRLPRRPVLLDGRLVGSWTRFLEPETVRIEVAVHEDLDQDGGTAIAAEAGRLAAHLGLEAELTLAEGEAVAAA